MGRNAHHAQNPTSVRKIEKIKSLSTGKKLPPQDATFGAQLPVHGQRTLRNAACKTANR